MQGPHWICKQRYYSTGHFVSCLVLESSCYRPSHIHPVYAHHVIYCSHECAKIPLLPYCTFTISICVACTSFGSSICHWLHTIDDRVPSLQVHVYEPIANRCTPQFNSESEGTPGSLLCFLHQKYNNGISLMAQAAKLMSQNIPLHTFDKPL